MEFVARGGEEGVFVAEHAHRPVVFFCTTDGGAGVDFVDVGRVVDVDFVGVDADYGT